MITGIAPTGSMHAADLRGGADVHALADLRARADERVRVDQRALADVGADVDVHRRHADDARARDTRLRGSTSRRARCARRSTASSRFSGSVSLSKNGQRPLATPMSTMSPKRKPSRMPCFTQALTRQPVGDDGIGLRRAHLAGRQLVAQAQERLARLLPRRAASLLEESGDARVDEIRSSDVAGSCSARLTTRAAAPSIFSCCRTRIDLLARGGARRHQRQTIALLEQPHRRHRRLYGNRIRFDEVDLHERQQPRVQPARAGVVAALRHLDDLRHLGRRRVRRHAR